VERAKPFPFPDLYTNTPIHVPHPSEDTSSLSETFTTAFGTVSFECLMERTRRYATYVFLHTYYLPPEAVDEALQAGYCRLWDKLHAQPDRLAQADVPWIGQQVVFQALHAHQAEKRNQQLHKGLLEGSQHSASRPHSTESRQSDLRLDLQQAIQDVAEGIMAETPSKGRDYRLWALYGLTMLHTTASESSQLFGVRKQSMQVAFRQVRERLQTALPHYAPAGNTRPYRQRGREAAPVIDMAAIRQGNQAVPDVAYESVATQIQQLQADTQAQDEVALAGIRTGVPVAAQARTHQIGLGKLRRAYQRVHLLLAAVCDPTIPTKRPEKRQQFHFTLTPENEHAVHTLALELVPQARSFEKLVALHAHISNLPVSRTAQHFHIPTATLRYYVQQIGERLGTPKVSAGADRRGFARQAVLFESRTAD
jgi:hypothetical protein